MGFDGQQGFKGAMGGAVMGSRLGPWGAVGGGVLGGLLGGFGGGGPTGPERSNYQVPNFQQQYSKYGQLGNQYAGRAAPQMGESIFRQNQQGFIKTLENQAAGHGPGQELVRQQAQTVADRAMSQQLGIAAGAAPGGGATAARTAALAGGQMQSAVGGQAAQAGLQAQLGAMGMLGSTLEGARGQDLSRAQANAGFKLQNRSINDQAQLEALRQRMGLSGMYQSGNIAYDQARMGQSQGQMGWGDMLMGAGMGAGQSQMMSQLGKGQPQQQPQQPNYSSMFRNQQTPDQWYQQNGYGNTPRWG